MHDMSLAAPLQAVTGCYSKECDLMTALLRVSLDASDHVQQANDLTMHLCMCGQQLGLKYSTHFDPRSCV